MATILIVEDNEENREALSRRLQRRGFTVVIATDGQQGVDTTLAQRPDLILMDLNMPIMDGWQAARLIRANAETAHLPIIGLTAHAMAEDREKAIKAGCTDYHTKPVDFPRLMTQIEALLKNSVQA